MINPPNKSPKSDPKYVLNVTVTVFEDKKQIALGVSGHELAPPQDSDIYNSVAWSKGDLAFNYAFTIAMLNLKAHVFKDK